MTTLEAQWVEPLMDPFEDDESVGTDILDVYDKVVETIEDDDIFQVQPTPIGSHGEVIVVPELTAQNDSNLCNSDIAEDFLALLSSEDETKKPIQDCVGKTSPVVLLPGRSAVTNDSSSFCGAIDFPDHVPDEYLAMLSHHEAANRECAQENNTMDNSSSQQSQLFALGERQKDAAANFELASDTFSLSGIGEKRSAEDNSFTISSCHPDAKKQKKDYDYGLFQYDGEFFTEPRKSFHCEQWDLRHKDLIEFKRVRGHCGVPNVFPPNPQLAQWVKRQRHQYKLKEEGKHSTLTDDRQKILEEIGFIWDSHESAWMERWNELEEFRTDHGHSNVPTGYDLNRALSVWVKCQRRQYKLYRLGKRTNMTAERIVKMESLDFNWNPRNLKLKKSEKKRL